MKTADNALVIVGAGASYDVANKANPHPAIFIGKGGQRYQPPLTNQLFLHGGICGEILPDYPQVRELASSIINRTTLRQATDVPPDSLEAVLREFARSKQPNRKSQILQLPLYLQEALWRASHEYVSEPVNYTDLIAEVLNQFDRVAFVTLNYDLLLDIALTRSEYWGPPFSDMDSYVREQWLLVKLHGSVDWGRSVETAPEEAARFGMRPIGRQEYNAMFGDHRFPKSYGKEIAVLHSLAAFHVRIDRLFYPVLAIPVDRQKAYVCPSAHVEALNAFLPSCRTVLAIGTSGTDRDLLQLLAKSLSSVDRFYVVSSGTSSEEPTHPGDNFTKVVPQLKRARQKRHDDGFTSFLVDGGMAYLDDLPEA